jgi:NAD(P)-dependent dehydrogenase (short-subunit alcohol dehydrogenase family)
MDTLEGRVAVVTGAASGIGRSLSGRFAREGMAVVLADVDTSALARATEEIGAASGSDRVVAVPTDVTDADAVESLAARAFDEFGAVHVLCNNAGVFAGGLAWECAPDDFEWALGVNLWGILHAIRAFVPRMLAQNDEGHIVNTSSMAGLATTPYCAPYEVSKFAATALTECLAHDLAAQGAPITVSLLVPGSVNTEIARSRRNRPERLASTPSASAIFVEQALAETTASGAHPDHVAEQVVYAIRDGTFLVPTTAGYRRQILDRAESLADRRLPGSAVFD